MYHWIFLGTGGCLVGILVNLELARMMCTSSRRAARCSSGHTKPKKFK